MFHKIQSCWEIVVKFCLKKMTNKKYKKEHQNVSFRSDWWVFCSKLRWEPISGVLLFPLMVCLEDPPQNPASHSSIRFFPVVRLCVWMFVDLCRTLKLLWGSTCWWTDSRGTRLQTWKVLPVRPAGPVLVPLCLTRMSSSDEEALGLDSLLDDSILDTAWRRRSYPKRILVHVVHALKAERKVLVGSVQPTSWHSRVT